jgi:hypothetical protein
VFSDSFVNARPPARLEIGRVIGVAFGDVGRDWLSFAIYGIILYVLPSIGRGYLAEWLAARDPALAAASWNVFLSVVQQLTLLSLLTAVIAWTVSERERGRSPGALAPFVAVAPQLIWILAGYFAYHLMMMIGLVLFVIPGLVAAVVFSVTVPTCVVDRLGVRASLTRSAALTRDQRWRIFVIQILVGLMGAVLSFFRGFATVIAGELAPAIRGDVSSWTVAVSTGVSAVIGAAVTARIYMDLRVIKEGATTQDVAQVFA